MPRKKGEVRIQTLVKFVNLCGMTINSLKLPTVDDIMQCNPCSRSNAYNYLRALKHLFPQEMLDQIRERRRNRLVQQALQ